MRLLGLTVTHFEKTVISLRKNYRSLNQSMLNIIIYSRTWVPTWNTVDTNEPASSTLLNILNFQFRNSKSSI